MRVALDVVRVEADQPEQVGDPLVLRLAAGEVMGLDRLGDDRPDRHPRVEGSIGVLEDDLHPAAILAQLARVEGRQVDAVEPDGPAGRVAEPDHRPADRALAAAGLADQAERLAAADRERRPVDRLDGPLLGLEDPRPDREVDSQVVDLDQVGRIVGGALGAFGAGVTVAVIRSTRRARSPSSARSAPVPRAG